MPLKEKSGAQAILYVDRVPTSEEIAQRDTHVLYEPPSGCYLGAFIDFDGSLHRPIWLAGHSHQDPAGFEQIIGKSHAMYFFYMGYGRPLPVEWIRWLGQHNKYVHVALEPNDGMERVKDDAYLHRLADDLARTGAKIFLRFASEMNGEWSVYHKDPALYRSKFRLVHSVIRKRAPRVALVWCPYESPIHNIPDYYPGDDGTDWVGVNLYSVTFHNNRLSMPSENEHPCDMLETVYRRYATRKPMMVCEFGATHFAVCEGRQRPDFACRKMLTLYTALPRIYPRIKCINYFDSNNLRFVTGSGCNDYSVTDDSEVNAAYRNAVSSPYFLDRPLADQRMATRMPIPMPLRPGELLRGPVHLSCWARAPSDLVIVRYKLDGRAIYQASRTDRWAFVWNAGGVRSGRHTLSLEALRPDGRVVARQTRQIITQH